MTEMDRAFRTPTTRALQILQDLKFDVTQDFDEPSGGAVKNQIEVTIMASMRRTSLEVTFFWLQRAQWIVDISVRLSGRVAQPLSDLPERPSVIQFNKFLKKSRAVPTAIEEGDKFQYFYSPAIIFPYEIEEVFILCRDFIEAALNTFGPFLTIE